VHNSETCVSCGTRGWGTCITGFCYSEGDSHSLPEFNIEQDGVCKGCMLGKHAKVAFPSSEHRSKEILDLVHSDVCGSMSVESILRSMYYVSFIDDFSRKTWIYFLKTKDEVFSRF
jgi:hypothetical protein